MGIVAAARVFGTVVYNLSISTQPSTGRFANGFPLCPGSFYAARHVGLSPDVASLMFHPARNLCVRTTSQLVLLSRFGTVTCLARTSTNQTSFRLVAIWGL